jgi:glyceraldehyde-3-phosphate dehydrogenase/erythrose-4-phosphate dehydrogenase
VDDDIHAYTNDQRILICLIATCVEHERPLFPHPDNNGCGESRRMVIPSLKGKMDGISMRAPVADVR